MAIPSFLLSSHSPNQLQIFFFSGEGENITCLIATTITFTVADSALMLHFIAYCFAMAKAKNRKMHMHARFHTFMRHLTRTNGNKFNNNNKNTKAMETDE